MESKAILKNVGISTKKARIPANIVRGMSVVNALSALKFMRKGTAPHVEKVIKSAVANAVKNGMSIENLFVSEIKVDKGQGRIRHYLPNSKGSGYSTWIRGKSHITVVLKEKNKVEEKDEVIEKKEVEEKEIKKVSKTKKPKKTD